MITPPLRPSPKMGGDRLRTDENTHEKLSATLHSSFNSASLCLCVQYINSGVLYFLEFGSLGVWEFSASRATKGRA